MAPLINVGTVLIIILLLALGLESRLKKRKPVPEERPKDPLTKAVDELMPLFAGMDMYFRRLDLISFQAFCQSMTSGISMKIRNKYGFYAMYTGKGSPSELYAFLCTICKKTILHPDEASNAIITAIYHRYWKTVDRTAAVAEKKRFDAFTNTPQYRPVHPFDILMPGDEDWVDRSLQKN